MSLRQRDDLLSRLAGVVWPFGPLVEALALDPGADVLDVGAGDGRLLAFLRERGHRGALAGVDPEPGAGVLPGTAGALPFPDRSLDVVLLVRVLAHLPDPARALSEARRVLRPAGRLVVAAHGPEHLRETWRALGQAGAPAGPFGHAPDLLVPVTVTAADAHALARSYGLRGQMGGSSFPVRDHLHLRVEVWAG